ncbi:hypothetical protein jhhlp_006445 [Lomentospora prolificans]|uniref:GDS1 winged helix domain-containing protein n=1 Tax=Lomentospora prolificans TaxID=41688 RepID=A0A2N3N5Z6_9PEZI|nr:hypothetical protein jhhlp_006445 [Lomentospora prolificans]
MPYNTRRKSLSLPSLGIHVPVTHAARAAAAAAAAASSRASSTSASTPTPSATPSQSESSPSPSEYLQTKRLKRAHNDDSISSASAHPATRTKYEHTPPPSPEATPSPSPSPSRDTTATDGTRRSKAAKRDSSQIINDEIVEAVVAQLQATGNRPHLVKELAAVLAQRLTVVQQYVVPLDNGPRPTQSPSHHNYVFSANPCAIISSRLASFLKRTCWSETSPCPLAKELEAVHPRRTYFFLTTSPRQPFPTQPLLFTLPKPATTSPSISGDELTLDPADDSDDDVVIDDTEIISDSIARRAMSPSPEVDLSSPEFDDMDEDLDSQATSLGSSRASLIIDRERRSRGASPPLERDEREFTQTANGLQKRKMTKETVTIIDDPNDPALGLDSETSKFDSLFHDHRFGSASWASMAMVVSPTMKPSPFASNFKKDGEENWVKIGRLLDWDQTPETMELEELDGLLDAY